MDCVHRWATIPRPTVHVHALCISPHFSIDPLSAVSFFFPFNRVTLESSSISNIDNQLFHLLCNLDRENAPDVIEEMVACLDRETLDENRQFIFADAKERYYEDLFAKGLQNQETLIPRRRNRNEADAIVAGDIVKLYMYGTRQTYEFPHETLAGMGFCLDMSSTIDQHDSVHLLKNETYPEHRGFAVGVPKSPSICVINETILSNTTGVGMSNQHGTSTPLLSNLTRPVSDMSSIQESTVLIPLNLDPYLSLPTVSKIRRKRVNQNNSKYKQDLLNDLTNFGFNMDSVSTPPPEELAPNIDVNCSSINNNQRNAEILKLKKTIASLRQNLGESNNKLQSQTIKNEKLISELKTLRGQISKRKKESVKLLKAKDTLFKKKITCEQN